MKRPAIFFDRDNTLIVSDGYLGDPAKVKLITGAAEAVARARKLGFATIVFSNQSGVARGMFDEGAVYAVNDRLDTHLRQQIPTAIIDRHEFCPFHPEATVERYRQDSELRKPKPGMIHRSAHAMALDLHRSWVIGDAPRDITAGKAAGCRAILFVDPSLTASPAATEPIEIEPDFTVSTLKEALDLIEKHSTRAADTPDTDEKPDPKHWSQKVPHAPAYLSGSTAPIVTEPISAHSKPLQPAPEVPPTAIPKPPKSSGDASSKVESLLEEILVELRRKSDPMVSDFSVPKLLAGITQVLTLATLFVAYLKRGSGVEATLMLAMVLQALTISLLIMGRQR